MKKKRTSGRPKGSRNGNNVVLRIEREKYEQRYLKLEIEMKDREIQGLKEMIRQYTLSNAQ